MSKKIFILIILTFSFALLPRASLADKASPSIVMSENGFEPAEMIIQKNTTVAFVNEDNVDRWPASNIHPTHEIYPEFDPKRPIPPGNNWVFKFKKAGTFKYHDHLLPHRKGIIEVHPSVVSLREKFLNLIYSIQTFLLNLFPKKPQALEANNPSSELDNLKQMAQTQGLEAAWQYLIKNYSNSTSKNAHDLAHFLGGLIYQKKGLDGVSICDGSFAFGCFHGFAEKAFVKDLSQLSQLEKACVNLGSVNSGPYASCIHGFGHGIATYFNTTDLQSALKECSQLGSGYNFCYDGVFMEFATNASDPFYTKDPNPLFPCHTLEDKYHQSCARNLPIVMAKFKGMDLASIVQVCSESDNKTIKYFCIDAIGLQAGQRWEGDIENIQKICDLITNPEDIAQCYSAAAGELVFQNYPLWQEATQKLCNQLSNQFKPLCIQRYQKVALDYSRK